MKITASLGKPVENPIPKFNGFEIEDRAGLYTCIKAPYNCEVGCHILVMSHYANSVHLFLDQKLERVEPAESSWFDSRYEYVENKNPLMITFSPAK
jgi:hypothetical protein